MLKNLLNKYQNFTLLAEDPDTLNFVKIDNVTNEILKRYRVYEIDFNNKVVYLETIKDDNIILITSNDSLQLPLAVVKNYNEAAKIMGVEATHIYRAARRAGRPDVLEYNNFLLIKI